MKKARCIKCGRPLRDPESIARGMGAACAGISDGRRTRQRSSTHCQGSTSYAAHGHITAGEATLFTLVDQGRQPDAQPVFEEAAACTSEPGKKLVQFPTYLVSLVLSAPTTGSIARHVKDYSKKKKQKGANHPGITVQEIRRMCIDLRLTFFPGMSTPQGKHIACVPYGQEDWKFDNSEKVMSRNELEAYLTRYGMIRSTNR